jgi:deoxyribonuclease V
MYFPPLHPWDLIPSQAVALQRRLATSVRTQEQLGEYELVAGADVSNHYGSSVFHAAVVLLCRGDWSVVESASAAVETPFAYTPGLLSFREAPALLAAFRRLRQRPDVVMIDGQGIAHPRRLGIASHVGLWLDLPTVGCAKSRLAGRFAEPGPDPGDRSPLVDRGEVIGTVLRTRARAGPLFVSPGHRIDLDGAVRLVLESGRGYRLPEPTRLAHEHANEARRLARPENV